MCGAMHVHVDVLTEREAPHLAVRALPAVWAVHARLQRYGVYLIPALLRCSRADPGILPCQLIRLQHIPAD